MHALSPVLDVALDPRWGRVHETFGEDPYLCAALGVAYVRGLQGEDLSAGCDGHRQALPGLRGCRRRHEHLGLRGRRPQHPGPVRVPLRGGDPPRRAAIGDELLRRCRRIPAGASPEVLQDLLRDTLGFDGFVSSDYTTIDQLVDRQRVAADAAVPACRVNPSVVVRRRSHGSDHRCERRS